MDFHEWKILCFHSHFAEVPKGPVDYKSGNGLATSNANPMHWRIYAAIGADELIGSGHRWIVLAQGQWCVLCCDAEQAVWQTVELPVSSDETQ